MKVVAVFAAVFTFEFAVGTSLGSGPILGAIGMLAVGPLTLMKAVSNAFPLFAPLAFLVVPVLLLRFYRMHLGQGAVLFILGSAVALMAA